LDVDDRPVSGIAQRPVDERSQTWRIDCDSVADDALQDHVEASSIAAVGRAAETSQAYRDASLVSPIPA
jgi:hypothetical protein